MHQKRRQIDLRLPQVGKSKPTRGKKCVGVVAVVFEYRQYRTLRDRKRKMRIYNLMTYKQMKRKFVRRQILTDLKNTTIELSYR